MSAPICHTYYTHLPLDILRFSLASRAASFSWRCRRLFSAIGSLCAHAAYFPEPQRSADFIMQLRRARRILPIAASLTVTYIGELLLCQRRSPGHFSQPSAPARDGDDIERRNF